MAEDTPIQKNASSGNEDYKKLSFFEAIKISKWGISLYLKNQPVETLLYIVTTIIRRMQDIAYTYIFSRALDELIRVLQEENASIEKMYSYLLILLSYSLVETIINFVYRRSFRVIRTKDRLLLKKELYQKLKTLGVQTLEQPEVNNKVFRSNDYIYQILPYVDESIEFMAFVVKVIATSVLVISFMPSFILIVLAVSIPYLLIDKKFRRQIYKLMYENTEKRRIANICAWDLSDSRSLQEISITGAFKYLDGKFVDFMTWLTSEDLKIDKKSRVWNSFFGILRDIIIFSGYLQIFSRFLKKEISLGNVTFWMRSLNILEESITSVVSYFNDLSENAMQIKDVYLLFQTKPAFPDGDIEMEKLTSGPEVMFRKVSFKYPNTDKLVIKDLDLKINKGEKIAIVGENGAGKTTLVKLLSKFYQTTKGDIEVNGININLLKSESLYENMGTLFQDFNVYGNLTVKENIAIGKTNIDFDEERMKVAARAADAISFIEEYPNKFDNLLSERYKGGTRPSTGQWQKIALARFFYRNAPLVIFDEPTAAIDAASEAKIFSKIYEFFEGKTVIIISHRFSTVRNADRIIVLDDGQIVEEGSHEELIKLNGRYAESFRLQAEGYKEDLNS